MMDRNKRNELRRAIGGGLNVVMMDAADVLALLDAVDRADTNPTVNAAPGSDSRAGVGVEVVVEQRRVVVADQPADGQ